MEYTLILHIQKNPDSPNMTDEEIIDWIKERFADCTFARVTVEMPCNAYIDPEPYESPSDDDIPF